MTHPFLPAVLTLESKICTLKTVPRADTLSQCLGWGHPVICYGLHCFTNWNMSEGRWNVIRDTFWTWRFELPTNPALRPKLEKFVIKSAETEELTWMFDKMHFLLKTLQNEQYQLFGISLLWWLSMHQDMLGHITKVSTWNWKIQC